MKPSIAWAIIYGLGSFSHITLIAGSHRSFSSFTVLIYCLELFSGIIPYRIALVRAPIDKAHLNIHIRKTQNRGRHQRGIFCP